MMTKIHEGLLVLLQELDEICSRNDIDFYLAGGCLVGSIRQGGFLSWDDDADIHMTRANAEKLASLQSEFPPNRIIVNSEKYEEYPEIHWRYMNTEKMTNLRSVFLTDSPAGQFVDIFILDPVPDDEIEQQTILEKFYQYLEFRARYIVESSTRSDEFYQRYGELRNEQKNTSFDVVHRRLYDELFSYKEEDCNSYLVRAPFAPCPIYRKELWGTPRRVRFENTTMPVAQKAEEVLMLAYGSRWIDIPAHIDRGSHIFANDQDLPYRIYDEDIKKHINKREALYFEYEKKDAWFSVVSDRNYANSRQRKMTTPIILRKIYNYLENSSKSLDEMVRDNDIALLMSVFAGYYNAQFNLYKYYNLYFDMPDDLLYAAMKPLFYMGSYDKIGKVLSFRKNERKDVLSPDLQDLDDYVDISTEVTNSIYVYKDYHRARELTSYALSRWPEVINIMQSDIALGFILGEPVENIEKRLNCYRDKYPRDGELMKYYADILNHKGEPILASKLYKKALGTIRNGMVQTEILNIINQEINDEK